MGSRGWGPYGVNHEEQRFGPRLGNIPNPSQAVNRKGVSARMENTLRKSQDLAYGVGNEALMAGWGAYGPWGGFRGHPGFGGWGHPGFGWGRGGWGGLGHGFGGWAGRGFLPGHAGFVGGAGLYGSGVLPANAALLGSGLWGGWHGY